MHLKRRLAMERRVRPMLVKPDFKEPKLPMERFPAKWHEDDPRAFVLEAQDEPFNERDTPMLADGAEAGCDPLAIAPVLEHAAPELLALVADDIFRSGTGGMNGAFEEVRNRYGCGIVPEGFNAHHTSRVVVDDRSESHPRIDAIGGPGARVYNGVVGQCDRMEYGRPNAVLPALGKMDPRWLRIAGHRDLRK